MGLRGSSQRRQWRSQPTVVAPLELVGVRQPEHSGGRNSPKFHPMQLERCGELTWVVLEWAGAPKHGT
jgi:hypothetical protein